MQCTGASRKLPVYSPEDAIPLSEKKTRVANESMRHTLPLGKADRMLQGGLTFKQSEVQQVYTRREGKEWHRKPPGQGC